VDTAAVVYLRISQDRTGQAAGVTRQRDDCERRARERGWRVIAVESDNDTSAAKATRQRPGFAAVLAAVEAGQARVVLAWSLDRLQRNRRDEVRLYEACQRHGVTLSLVNGADLDFTTAAGRFVADSLGSVARLEIELKSDRQRAAQAQAARQGRRVGGRRPFGYEPDGTTVREHEAAAIRDGYRQLLAGVSLGEIARGWNTAGLSTGQNNAWRRGAVRDVLLNPRNAGLRGHGSVPERGRRKIEVIGPANWPALINEATWEAAHRLLTDTDRRTGGGARALLTGVAMCGVCGAPVHAGGASRGQGRAYRCSGSTGHVARRAEPVDDYVSAVIVERLSRPDARELLLDQDRPDIDKLHTEAMALRHRLDQLAVDFADGGLTASQLRVATERARAHLADVEAQMGDAGRVDVLGPLVSADDVHAVWDALSTARKRAVIDVLCTVVILPPGRGARVFRPESVIIEPKIAQEGSGSL
jgi:DNA invertase Pin-like site-specific DNA recombinase